MMKITRMKTKNRLFSFIEKFRTRDLQETEDLFAKSVACIFQWNYPVINLGRNEVRNCCRANPNVVDLQQLSDQGPEVIQNLTSEREKRARMILGERPKGCESCWVLESKNVRSPRVDAAPLIHEPLLQLQNSPDLMKKLKKATYESRVKILSQHPITYSKTTNMLEIVLANTCDMKCMYCSHHYSSRWAQELIQYGEITESQLSRELPKPIPEFKQNFLEWFKKEGWQNVKYINFIGGEPSLINEFYELSESLGQTLKENGRTNVILSIVTNLNNTPVIFNKFTSHLRVLSQYFDEIDVNVSIEAMGKKAEYIRHGLVWDRWQQNFENLCSQISSPSRVSLQMATNILSVSSLPELIHYCWYIFEKFKIPVNLRQNIVSFPAAHSPLLLNSDFIHYLDDAISFLKSKKDEIDPLIKNDFGEWGRYANFLESIRENILRHEITLDEKQLVRDFFQKYDSRRGLDIHSVFPEYKKFFEECQI